MIEIPVSIGELIDKITILRIKKLKIKDESKLYHVQKELDLLISKCDDIANVKSLVKQLYRTNLKLWNIEDSIRIKESKREFDQQFIDLARSVYQTNDVRAEIKRQINQHFNSSIFEVKSYEHY